MARYTQNRINKNLWTTDPDELTYACDGIVELEFVSELAMTSASSSDAVKERLPEEELRFLHGITLAEVPAGAR